jgi:hypothetical protein
VEHHSTFVLAIRLPKTGLYIPFFSNPVKGDWPPFAVGQSDEGAQITFGAFTGWGVGQPY